MSPPFAVVVHHLAQARAALAEAERQRAAIVLRSPPGAAASAGVAFFAALEQELGHPIVVDCGDAPGHVMAGLRVGLKRLLFSGSTDVLARLQAMAAQQGAEVSAALMLPTVELEPEDEAATALGTAMATSR